jgi:hypothetical protein
MVAAVVAAQAPAAGGRGGGGGPAMTLTTPAFPDGGDIPVKYTQAGDQTSPALTWAHAPAATVSFVLHVHDMDVVHNHTTDDQLHWVVWNIPPTSTGMPEGVPKGADLKDGSHQTSASGQFFRGPGAGANGPKHHYMFEVFALDTKVDVPAETDPFDTWTSVAKAMQGHILAKAVYGGLFHRPQ